MRMIDYVAMPLLVAPSTRRDAYDVAHGALERVGAARCGGQLWESLSDWERALVELAQAIAAGPRLLLIDDVTDTLGVRETDELTGLVHELTREWKLAALMCVSNGTATLRCDRVLTLSCGGLIEATPRAEARVIEFPDVSAAHSGAGRMI
jgi:ABC-type cobalamin/Fe3+-siderophores transport system ATPase subunit